MGTPMGFKSITYARSTILEDCIKDFGKEPSAVIVLRTNQEQCPRFPSDLIDNTNRKDCRHPSQRDECPGYLQRLGDELSKKINKKKPYEDLEHTYVVSRLGIDQRAGVSKINPTIDNFGITTFDGERDTPIQSPCTIQQLRNYSLTLPRIILSPVTCGSHIILNLCTPTGSIQRWVPESHGKLERRDARKSGWGDLRVLGERARTN